MEYCIIRESKKICTENGEVEREWYTVRENNCVLYTCRVGERVKVLYKKRGSGIEAGRVGTVERVMEDRYGKSFVDILGNHCNYLYLVNFDGQREYIIGEKLSPLSMEGKVEEVEGEKEEVDIYTYKKYGNPGVIYYFDNSGVLVRDSGWLSSTQESVHGKYIKEIGGDYCCVVYNWVEDTYSFLVFDKKSGEIKASVSKGQGRIEGDNGGDTGLGSAIRAYEEWK